MKKEDIKNIIPKPIVDVIFKYRFIKTTELFSKRPFYGVLRLMRWIIFDILNRDISFSTPDGTRFLSMPRNYSSFIVYFDDYRDPSIQMFLEKHLTADSIFIDAGANIGTYTVRAAQLLGPQGKVIAIEAHPHTYNYLLRNINLNNLKNVIPLNIALGSEHGIIDLSYSFKNAGETHIAIEGENKVTVPLRTLDETLKELGVTQVDYIKIDVEGFEFPLLKGSRDTIMCNEKIVIQTELDARHTLRYGHPITETIDLLFSLGLIPHEIDSEGNPASMTKDTLKIPSDVLWWRE